MTAELNSTASAHLLAANLQAVHARIAAACCAAGRARSEVTLVAVSKTVPVEHIRLAYQLGQRDFGENYVQELRHKAQALADLPELRWHFIGPLQRNKAQHVVGTCTVIHSVSSTALIARLNELARLRELRQDILLQLNLGGEASKAGASEADLESLVEQLHLAPALRCCGLMCIPPYFSNPREAEPFFQQLQNLRDQALTRYAMPAAHWQLSMGMSHDLEPAIAQGATLVRIGTAIFGQRMTPRATKP